MLRYQVIVVNYGDSHCHRHTSYACHAGLIHMVYLSLVVVAVAAIGPLVVNARVVIVDEAGITGLVGASGIRIDDMVCYGYTRHGRDGYRRRVIA